MYLSKYFLHRSVKLIQLWPLTRHICDKTRRGIWIAFHPPFMDDEWREHLISVTKKWRRPVLALNVHLCLCDPVSPFFSLGSTDRGKGQTKCKQALFFPSCIFFFFFFFFFIWVYHIVEMCNWKYHWHMKRTYIFVQKWSLMPWKDRRLAVFMFVRIRYLKERGRNIDYVRSPHFHRFDLVVVKKEGKQIYIACLFFQAWHIFLLTTLTITIISGRDPSTRNKEL